MEGGAPLSGEPPDKRRRHCMARLKGMAAGAVLLLLLAAAAAGCGSGSGGDGRTDSGGPALLFFTGDG